MEAARPATEDDVLRVLELTHELRAELADHRGGNLWHRTHDPIEHTAPGLRSLLGYPEDCLLVGCIDDSVVGYLLARAHTLADGSRLAKITELYVEPGAREVAVGEALANAALAWATEHGCVGMDATALPGDRAAKNFFETNGFVARSLTMHRSLVPTETSGPHTTSDATPGAGDPV